MENTYNSTEDIRINEMSKILKEMGTLRPLMPQEIDQLCDDEDLKYLFSTYHNDIPEEEEENTFLIDKFQVYFDHSANMFALRNIVKNQEMFITVDLAKFIVGG